MKSEQEKREEFKNILLELASDANLLESQTECTSMYARLEELYSLSDPTEKFRHFYSDIFEVLCRLRKDAKLGTADILGQNMGILYERYEPVSQDRDISKELKKLYDHVSLDIARMTYSDAGDYRISGKKTVQELQSRVETLTAEINEAHEKQEEMNKELKSQQREYVAILGIFAAVVITFIGGLAFSTSVLNNIDKVSTAKLMMIALTIGLVLVHVIFGLFHYVDMLVNGTCESWKVIALLISSVIIIAVMACIVYFCPYLKHI